MTKQELKEVLTPIVCDSNLTRSMQSEKLAPIVAQWIEANPDLTLNEIFDSWNNIMADIIIEQGLGG